MRDLIIRGCWLWQLADPAAFEDHLYNIHRDKEFLEYNALSFVRKRMIVYVIEGPLPLSREKEDGSESFAFVFVEPTAPHPQSISSVQVGSSE